MPSFIDEATIKIQGGNGGDGIVSFRHEKYIPKGGPDGGDGGRGGSVYLQADTNINTLSHFRQKKKYLASAGERGGKSNKHGKSGPDLTIKIPVGTIVKAEQEDGQEQIYDLSQPGQIVMVAKGGNGGKGNARFATSTQRRPTKSTPGQAGQLITANLELKLLADIGLVGLPNAGKSTLLANLTSANPKIGSYPFTTLEPNLGVAHYHDKEIIFADIPGLIEGASQGKGLGDQFLRHVERTKAIFHLISLDPDEGDPWARYQVIQNELKAFNPALAEKHTVTLLTKADMVDEESIQQTASMFSSKGIEVISVNILSEIDRQKILKEALAIADDHRQKKSEGSENEEVTTYRLADLPQKFRKG